MIKYTVKSFIDFLSRKTFLAILIVMILGVIIHLIQPPIRMKKNIVSIRVCNSTDVDSIITIDDTLVMPILYQKVPNLIDIHYKERMQKFIDMMLPSILMAKEKINQERYRVLETDAAVRSGIGSYQDSLYLKKMKEKFKTSKIPEVLHRLHPHPVSIVLAQAAIESGWGTSRFCREANNIYGIWSYSAKEKRIRASESRNGKAIYLRKYDSLFESIYDYYQTIAKANAYRQFRKIRLETENPYRLIWYLSNYSEKRYEYVRTLRNVIEFNDLHKYDEYRLADFDQEDEIWQGLLD